MDDFSSKLYGLVYAPETEISENCWMIFPGLANKG